MTEQRVDRVDRMLMWSIRAMAVAFAVCLVGVFIDDREVLGASTWLKPLKFSISIGVVVAGLRWLRRQLPRDRWVDGAAIASAGALFVEQVLIGMQAGRGVRSHFNGATPFDSQVYGLMGMFVAVVFVAGVVVAWRSFCHRGVDVATRAVVRVGSAVAVLGMSVGAVMTMPLPNQQLPSGVVGAHSIGGPDGGVGLPLLGWSAEHGDLRPAHFMGLHGLHVLIGVAAVLRRRNWSSQESSRAVVAVGRALAVATVLLAVQAVMGVSVLSLSTVAVAAGVGLIVLSGRRRPGASGIQHLPTRLNTGATS